VEEALCYGWIDNVGGKVDGERTMLLFSPRRKGSVWSKLNKDRVEKSIAQGLMRKPGLDKIEAAKADGSWAALDDVDAMIVPADLAEALRANPAGQAAWNARTDSRKKQALQWLASAKRPETYWRNMAWRKSLRRLARRARRFPRTIPRSSGAM